MQAEHYNGLIAVWKEQGYTSHDVVAKLRGILHQKKIGHTGTLDPQAEGVLAVGLGLGTKTFDLLPDHWKTYEAEVTFGVQTDTEDIWGNVLKTHDVSKTPEEIIQAICSFGGTYDQIPPMYSAKKIDGKKLYQLAREGKIVDTALDHFPKVIASNEFEKQLKNGNAIGSNAVLGLQEASIDVCSHDICVRLYLNNNGLDEFIGVYHLDKSSRLLKPVKIFYRN